MPGPLGPSASTPIFRDSSFAPTSRTRPALPAKRYGNQDIRASAPPQIPAPTLRAIVEPTQPDPPASVARPKPLPLRQDILEKRPQKRSYFTVQRLILAMACLVFLAGIAIAFQAFYANRATAKQAAALTKKPASSNDTGPSTAKPSAAAVANYVVASTLPRYLNVPSLGVQARVFSLGLLASGALATPGNVYDTGWYNESSLPGQPGAMLIDGHVSSWTTKGVFYGLKNLHPGDKLQIERGDGTVFSYQVVKTQVYPSNNVDMKSAITPVTAGKPGLNLITCTGDVIRGTNEFNKRIIVYSQQI